MIELQAQVRCGCGATGAATVVADIWGTRGSKDLAPDEPIPLVLKHMVYPQGWVATLKGPGWHHQCPTCAGAAG